MYTTGRLFFSNGLSPDVRPRQNLEIHEDLFLYEYARLLLHKRLVSEGMLSPYANPFHLPTDTVCRETEKERDGTRTNIDKKTIAEKLNREPEDITLQEDKILADDNETWIEVKRKVQRTKNEQKETNKSGGYYEILQKQGDEKEETNEETTEDEKNANNRGKDVKNKVDTRNYDVNTMTMGEIEEVIYEVKEASVQVESLEVDEKEECEASNEKSNEYDVKQHIHSLKDLAAEYEEENEQLKLKTVQLEVYIESMTVEYQKTKEEVRTLKSKIQEINQVSKDNSDLTNELAMQDETKIEELENQMDILRKENSQVNELVQELGEVIKQSDNTINEYKKDNEDLRQKLWKAIRRIQSKDNDLEEKKSELESAYEVIEELEDRLRDLGEDFDKSDEDN